MEGFGPTTYGDGFADVYDDWYGGITDAAATAAFVAERVIAGVVLELGVGSGRLVGPLTTTGLRVVGVDASASMLERCRLGHSDVPVVRADLARLPINGPIGGALCAFNTLFNLPSADQQRMLLASLATALDGDAPLIIEAISGNNLDAGPRSSVGVSKMTTDQLVLSATVLDHEAQTIQGQHIDITEQGIVLRPWMLRWTTPDQLDALADEAGLTLTERYGGWHREPFGPDSETHISVYRRTG